MAVPYNVMLHSFRPIFEPHPDEVFVDLTTNLNWSRGAGGALTEVRPLCLNLGGQQTVEYHPVTEFQGTDLNCPHRPGGPVEWINDQTLMYNVSVECANEAAVHPFPLGAQVLDPASGALITYPHALSPFEAHEPGDVRYVSLLTGFGYAQEPTVLQDPQMMYGTNSLVDGRPVLRWVDYELTEPEEFYDHQDDDGMPRFRPPAHFSLFSSIRPPYPGGQVYTAPVFIRVPFDAAGQQGLAPPMNDLRRTVVNDVETSFNGGFGGPGGTFWSVDVQVRVPGTGEVPPEQFPYDPSSESFWPLFAPPHPEEVFVELTENRHYSRHPVSGMLSWVKPFFLPPQDGVRAVQFHPANEFEGNVLNCPHLDGPIGWLPTNQPHFMYNVGVVSADEQSLDPYPYGAVVDVPDQGATFLYPTDDDPDNEFEVHEPGDVRWVSLQNGFGYTEPPTNKDHYHVMYGTSSQEDERLVLRWMHHQAEQPGAFYERLDEANFPIFRPPGRFSLFSAIMPGAYECPVFFRLHLGGGVPGLLHPLITLFRRFENDEELTFSGELVGQTFWNIESITMAPGSGPVIPAPYQPPPPHPAPLPEHIFTFVSPHHQELEAFIELANSRYFLRDLAGNAVPALPFFRIGEHTVELHPRTEFQDVDGQRVLNCPHVGAALPWLQAQQMYNFEVICFDPETAPDPYPYLTATNSDNFSQNVQYPNGPFELVEPGTVRFLSLRSGYGFANLQNIQERQVLVGVIGLADDSMLKWKVQADIDPETFYDRFVMARGEYDLRPPERFCVMSVLHPEALDTPVAAFLRMYNRLGHQERLSKPLGIVIRGPNGAIAEKRLFDGHTQDASLWQGQLIF